MEETKSRRGGIFALLLGAAAYFFLGPVIFFILIFFGGMIVAQALPLIIVWIILCSLPKLLSGISVFAKMQSVLSNNLILRLAWWGLCFYVARYALVLVRLLPD